MDTTIELPALRRAAELAPNSADAEARTIDVVWSTGARVRRVPFFGEPYDEDLSLEADHVRLDRLNAGAPFLKVYETGELSAVIGSVVPGSARIEQGRGVATIRFSDRDDVEPIWRDIQAGHIRAVSIGYQVHRYEVNKPEGVREVWRAVDWTPFEISAVPVGADADAGFRSIHDPHAPRTHECVVHRDGAEPPYSKRTQTMHDEDTRENDAAEVTEATISEEAPKAPDDAAETRAQPQAQSQAQAAPQSRTAEAEALVSRAREAERERGTLGESKESYRIETYGRVVAITRQVLINDDLDAFTRIPAMYGNAIAQLESDVVWDIITANPAMADNKTLFHADHKNLAGTGKALGVDAVGVARAVMAKQTGLDKKTVLNIRPSFLIVPASLELKAEQMVAQNLVPADTAKVVSQSIRTLSPISEPRLDAVSETAWYLAASPNQIDTIEYAYLEGQQGAYIETRNGFDVDGVEIKCRLDFGAKAIDWRGLYKNPGA